MEFTNNTPLLNKDIAKQSGCCKKYAIFWVILVLVFVGITLGLVFRPKCKTDDDDEVTQQGIGAVVSNGAGCAEIGGKILEDGGSAVDAAIATLLCEGIILPHSLGIGGGFIATIYTKETGKVETLIARETAPRDAYMDMFVNKEITGAIAAAVPGEIYGYWRLHRKYGKLPWKVLFEPSIKLCMDGHKVTRYLANALELHEVRIASEPTMAEIFVNPETGKLYQEGDTMYRPKLGETLRLIADNGAGIMYDGGIVGKLLTEDVQEMGGIITQKDLESYNVRWEEPIVAHITGKYSVYTTPLPTSGAILALILNMMDPLYTNQHDVYWQRVIETFKHAYGHRTNLGDLHFEPQIQEIFNNLTSAKFAAELRELILDDQTFTDYKYYGANFSNEEDNGTANMAVLAPNGDGITVTSTINSHLGAKVRSRRTGIILNDEMDDFSTPGHVNTFGIPPSPANYIKPGKRPMSSSCPSIVIDKNGNVRMLVGGAGGSRITTSVAQAILRYLVFNDDIQTALDAGRIHHQLAPMYVDVEPEVEKHINAYLIDVGHELNFLRGDKAVSALTAIGMKTREPVPHCDRRRVGGTVLVYGRKKLTKFELNK